MANNSPKLKVLNLAVQQFLLKKQFPYSECRISRSELTWLGTLLPTPISSCYRVQLSYKLNGSPKVEVISPSLERREGKKPPHLYRGDRLCLYLPRIGEWNKNMLLSETIIPWTSEWLLHYEIWLATGEWCGGGIHPPKN